MRLVLCFPITLPSPNKPNKQISLPNSRFSRSGSIFRQTVCTGLITSKPASIKPGMELELAEYCWAFLAFMHQEGVSVEFLSIANVQNSAGGLVINPGRAFANSTVSHIRTSITEDAAIISKATGHDPKVAIELPPRSLNTWRFRKD